MMTRWDPFAEIEIAGRTDEGSWFTPAVDLSEERDAVLVRVALPGVRPDDVTIEATARLLTLSGTRGDASFSRTFRLPDTVDGENSLAIMSDGVLTVRIPKRSVAAAKGFAA